jgi:hypothetical protein
MVFEFFKTPSYVELELLKSTRISGFGISHPSQNISSIINSFGFLSSLWKGSFSASYSKKKRRHTSVVVSMKDDNVQPLVYPACTEGQQFAVRPKATKPQSLKIMLTPSWLVRTVMRLDLGLGHLGSAINLHRCARENDSPLRHCHICRTHVRLLASSARHKTTNSAYIGDRCMIV